jgi:predicted Holliday junction resolvase-like endonuclease
MPGSRDLEPQLSRQVIEVWWQIIVIVAVLIFVIYLFLVIVGFRTRLLTRKTDRTAESMYSNYADSDRKQQKYAREHGGQWRDDEGSTAP